MSKANEQSHSLVEFYSVIASIVFQQLSLHGIVSFYIDRDGDICTTFPGEMQLDGIPEDMAIEKMLNDGSTDEEVSRYLRGREDRFSMQDSNLLKRALNKHFSRTEFNHAVK